MVDEDEIDEEVEVSGGDVIGLFLGRLDGDLVGDPGGGTGNSVGFSVGFCDGVELGRLEEGLVAGDLVGLPA